MSLKPKINTQVPRVWGQNSDIWIHSEEKRQQTVSYQGMEMKNDIHLFLSQIPTWIYSWDRIMDSNHIFSSSLSFSFSLSFGSQLNSGEAARSEI